ncbi:MAG: hypothetical protein B6I28_03740 [Fusobacteriia bacterium 4572_132]|nr:MAG: hypothetical protein B6I28_03740 [Fusobacteriia bacterium 4572_132]
MGCLKKMKTTQAYSYNILDELNMELEVNENPFNIDIKDLFGMAARINKKRSFLFVSKVLGKHIPVSPFKVMYMGRVLGELYANKEYKMEMKSLKKTVSFEIEDVKKELLKDKIDLPENNIFIGFAETATALGHSVFETFKNAKYIHTTRENINEEPIFDFKEEHSHATDHKVFSQNKAFFENENQIVLVDDEITTGKTVLNIIKEIQKKYPRQSYSILTLLDWRTEEHKKKYIEMANKLGIKINVYSLISGNVKVEGKADIKKDNVDFYNVEEKVEINEYYFDDLFPTIYKNYIEFTGRFGIDSKINKKIEDVSKKVAEKIDGKERKKLVLGVGEFMFLPLKIASFMNGEVYFHSTTRSPILAKKKCDYAIQSKFVMYNIYNSTVKEFLYNIPEDYYDSVYIFYERYSSKKEVDKMKKELEKIGIKKINMCFMLNN